jgi:CopG family transcriptional regulator / antitoxin EndoAI
MNRGQAMNKRLNITLPERTVKLIDRVASKGQRSRLIDRAVKRYIEEESRTNLRKQLEESAIANATYDLELAEEWFPLEEEAWRRPENQ